jgi:hypothetical protein
MTSRDQVLSRVLGLAVGIAGPGRVPSSADALTPLGPGGLWLDSVDLLELVLACEVEFAVTFEADVDLAGPALDTIGALADLVLAKRAPRARSERSR